MTESALAPAHPSKPGKKPVSDRAPSRQRGLVEAAQGRGLSREFTTRRRRVTAKLNRADAVAPRPHNSAVARHREIPPRPASVAAPGYTRQDQRSRPGRGPEAEDKSLEPAPECALQPGRCAVAAPLCCKPGRFSGRESSRRQRQARLVSSRYGSQPCITCRRPPCNGSGIKCPKPAEHFV